MSQETASILVINDRTLMQHSTQAPVLPTDAPAGQAQSICQDLQDDLVRAIKYLGPDVVEINSAAKGIQMVANLDQDAVFLGVHTAAAGWTKIVATLSRNAPDIPVIVSAEQASPEDVRLAFQAGAFDCLPLPQTDIRHGLRRIVDRALTESNRRRKEKNDKVALNALNNEAERGAGQLRAEISSLKKQLIGAQDRHAYEQQIALENKKMFQIMFKNTHDTILHLDRNGFVVNVNETIRDFFGLSPQEVIGRSMSEYSFLGPDYMQALELYKAATPKVPFPVFELEAFRRDGTKIYIEVQAKHIVKDKEIEGIINIIRDITPHRRLENAKNATILGMAKLAESRDDCTGRHLERIREYVKILATALSRLPRYANYITPAYINDIYHSSILHDIGKVSTPDTILLKPGRLTPEEMEIMKQHTIVGGKALAAVDTHMQEQSFLTLAKEIAYYHHESWNGSGYPEGLQGEAIPLSARIVALADVYDALTTPRVYKKAFSHQKAVEIIHDDRGTKFAPDVVDAFESNLDEFDKIRSKTSMDDAVSSITNAFPQTLLHSQAS